MKLLQLNMWMGRLTRQIILLINQERPDFITAQEVFDGSSGIAFPDQMFDLFSRIKDAGYPYAAFAPCYTMDVSGKKVAFGNATFSKVPIDSWSVVFSHGQQQYLHDGEQAIPNVRNALFTTVTSQGKLLHIVNHHGYWVPSPVGSDASTAAMQIVADELKKLNGSIIFAGDLNVAPGAPALRHFDGFLEDLTHSYAIPTTLSPLSIVGEDIACDHIYISKGITVKDYRALDYVASDHKALSMIFD